MSIAWRSISRVQIWDEIKAVEDDVMVLVRKSRTASSTMRGRN